MLVIFPIKILISIYVAVLLGFFIVLLFFFKKKSSVHLAKYSAVISRASFFSMYRKVTSVISYTFDCLCFKFFW